MRRAIQRVPANRLRSIEAAPLEWSHRADGSFVLANPGWPAGLLSRMLGVPESTRFLGDRNLGRRDRIPREGEDGTAGQERFGAKLPEQFLEGFGDRVRSATEIVEAAGVHHAAIQRQRAVPIHLID